ncbi:TolC family protein [Massilia sp. YIM B02443]|uniref:TolC family protein n=1 Tax=Massilia sp. YIM B02443 TaxID=3050127 RepID=UPI0025B71B4F|nr:TolC family protein [Massilia sp. YIM B02443]MDN4039659.1 TolC family protein [Massilia sp. YIM B02443]
MNAFPLLHRPLAAAAALLLAGCAGVAPHDTFKTSADLARTGAGAEARLAYTDDERRALAAEVEAMLKTPLDIDAAVRLALLNHPGLQATYHEAGIAQADLVQATRLRNPSFGFARMAGDGEREIERGVGVDLAGLLTMPLRQRMAARRHEEATLRIAAAIERHAHDTRRAWIEAVAARQALDYARQVAAAADASSALTTRMRQAGNASALDLAREQAFHAEAGAAVLRAGRELDSARERLTRQLGLWGAQAGYALPERLPDLPAQPSEGADIERLALERRLDVRTARAAAAGTASDLGLTRTTRLVNVFDLGYASKSETGKARSEGYDVALELPLFDWGGARVARAESLYLQALGHVAQTAVDARSQARAAYLGYRASYDVARHYREHVLPLRKKIADETLLRYNGMLASPFELLLDAREQAAAVHAAIQAQRDFWLADTELRAALGGPLPAPAASEHDQHHHHSTHDQKEPTP